MPYTIEFESNCHGAILTYSDYVTGLEIVESVKLMYEADKQNKLCYSIADFTETTRLEYDEDDLRRLAFIDYNSSMGNPDQVVAVVGAKQLFKGSHKRYTIYTEVWSKFKCQYFDHLTEARDWVVNVSQKTSGDQA